MAHLAREALRVPGRRHGPDDAAHDELAALAAAGRVQDVEVVLAVFPPLELVEHAVGEGPETLSTTAGGIKMPVTFASLRLVTELNSDIITHTKHFGWYIFPSELTVLESASNGSSHREHNGRLLKMSSYIC